MAQLAFSREFPERLHYIQKETFSQEKILTCLQEQGVEIPEEMLNSKYLSRALVGKVAPKIHTFRKVGARRLKPGDRLHPTINARTKESFQFAPDIELVSKEVFEITREEYKPGTFRVRMAIGTHQFDPLVINGGVVMSVSPEVKQMVLNDGFETTKLFFSWFPTEGIYECLHWTKFKYEHLDKAREERKAVKPGRTIEAGEEDES